jgi:hypothetical protein
MTKLRILGLALVAVFAFSAVGSSIASAKEPTWWVCQKGTGSEEFTDHTCTTKQAGGGWIEKELAAGEHFGVTFEQKSTEAVKKRMKAKVGSITLALTCEKDKGVGDILGGVPGTDKLLSDTFEKCTVVEPTTGCKLENGSIAVAKSNTTLRWRESTNEKALDQIAPETGTVFATFKLEGCLLGIGNGTWSVEGELLALVLPVKAMAVTGELWFSEKETEPCTLVTKYWTGDPPNRVEHTIKPLELNGPLGKGAVEQFCEVKKVALSGAAAGWAFGVFPQGKTL